MLTQKLALGALAAALTVANLDFAFGADLLRHRHHRSRLADVYADDYACPIQEPAVYRPRIANYHEPLCFAARPYGTSTHLYDHSREIGAYNAAAGY